MAKINFGSTMIMDGGLGTALQKLGLKQGQRPEELMLESPEIIYNVHKSYVEAGADIIYTNTFGANRFKLAGSPYTTGDIVKRAVEIARAVCNDSGKGTLLALDIGPLGEMMEPAGTLSFDDAYMAFGEIISAGVKSGVDIIVLETMTDLYEMKAGVLAAGEIAPGIPLLVSMAFEKDGRTFTGTSVEAFAAAIEHLGPAALGINCSLGPAEILPLTKRLCESTFLPVFVKPNAGLPNPVSGGYDLDDNEFARIINKHLECGAGIIGGCCGTSPETIRLIARLYKGNKTAERKINKSSRVSGRIELVEINSVIPIGERINPTGKKRLQQALLEKDMGYLQTQAVLQENDGARILDVNVGAPGVDETLLLPAAVKAIQAVSGLPLQLDSANPRALEAALRIYNGKAIVNSTTGEKEKLDAILPLCKKYGAAVVGLTLDENGIPETPEGRLEIAGKILDAALKCGIAKEDVYIDCLTLTVSADENAPRITLEATRLVKERLGLKTLLGVSNVSFGLPARPVVNTAFLTMAMENGLDMPILNPAVESMTGAIYAFNLLSGNDKKAGSFIEKYAGDKPGAPVPASQKGIIDLQTAVEKGLKAEAYSSTKALLAAKGENGEAGADGMFIIEEHLVPALDRVGAAYEAGRMFLPQLLAAADAAQAAFEAVKEGMGGAAAVGPPVVVATVKGDVHDIGKNIARVLLENYGFKVIDLGRDVPPIAVLNAVLESGARLAGLSALMTTTLPSMEETLRLIKANAPECKVLVAGAVLTEEYANKIGADFYAKNGLDTVNAARKIYT